MSGHIYLITNKVNQKNMWDKLGQLLNNDIKSTSKQVVLVIDTHIVLCENMG